MEFDFLLSGQSEYNHLKCDLIRALENITIECKSSKYNTIDDIDWVCAIDGMQSDAFLGTKKTAKDCYCLADSDCGDDETCRKHMYIAESCFMVIKSMVSATISIKDYDKTNRKESPANIPSKSTSRIGESGNYCKNIQSRTYARGNDTYITSPRLQKWLDLMGQAMYRSKLGFDQMLMQRGLNLHEGQLNNLEGLEKEEMEVLIKETRRQLDQLLSGTSGTRIEKAF